MQSGMSIQCSCSVTSENTCMNRTARKWMQCRHQRPCSAPQLLSRCSQQAQSLQFFNSFALLRPIWHLAPVATLQIATIRLRTCLMLRAWMMDWMRRSRHAPRHYLVPESVPKQDVSLTSLGFLDQSALMGFLLLASSSTCGRLSSMGERLFHRYYRMICWCCKMSSMT